MGRPHVEPLVDRDVEAKTLRLPGWSPGITYRTLSIDPLNGACTQVVELVAGFEQEAGFSRGEWELFLLDGTIEIDGVTYRKDHYFFVPAGYRLPTIKTSTGCRGIWFWNDHYPDWVKATDHRDGEVATKEFISTNANDEVRWVEPSFYPQTEPGIFLKILRFDEETGALTGLYVMVAGFWQDNVSYHDCMEESYHIWGESWMLQFGYLPTGGYFYRPPYVGHGPFQCEYGTYAIFRTDSWLVNHFNWNPYLNPEENRLRVIDKIRKQKPLLTDWTLLTKDDYVP